MSDHRIEVSEVPHYRLPGVLTKRYRIVCPNDGQGCECWSECPESHVCPDCGDALCTDWLYEDDGMLHGQEHEAFDGMICVREPSRCWMQSWDIEFDKVPDDGWPIGIYDFDMDEPDDAFGGTIYVTAMRPQAVAADSTVAQTPHGPHAATEIVKASRSLEAS